MNIQSNTMASDRGDNSVTKVPSPKNSPSKQGSPLKGSPLRRTTSIKLARQGAQQPSKASQGSPTACRSLSRDGTANRALSMRNLNGTTAGMRRSGSNSQLSTSLHSSTAASRAGAVRRTRSGDVTAMASSVMANRTAAARSRSRDPLASSTHSVQSRAGRPVRDRSADSSRSLVSRESLGSNKSLVSRESLGSRKSLDRSNHDQDMQERIKQRAALRAAGNSSRSLVSQRSDDGSQPSLARKPPVRTNSAEGASMLRRRNSSRSLVSQRSDDGSQPSLSRKPPLKTNSAEGKSMFTRRPLGRSLSSNRLGANTGAAVAPVRRRSYNQNLTRSASGEGDKEVQDLQQQILKAQKCIDNDDSNYESDTDSEASAVQRQLDKARQTLRNLDKPAAPVSPPASPKRSQEKDSLSKSPSLVTPSLEDVILKIGKTSDEKEGSTHSTTSTVRLEELESYRRERQNDDSTRRRSRSRLDELRQSRRDQESQLRSMVKKQHAGTSTSAATNDDDDKAVDSADVMKVIVNLRDELAAAQQVIEQQRVIMEVLSEQAPPQTEQKESSQRGTSSLGGWFSSATTEEETAEPEVPLPPETVPKKQYDELQARFSKLQMDRAWAEFQLRDRITLDALKFHRRLRHWKDQSIELRCTIQNMENDNAQALVAAQKKEDERFAELEEKHAEKVKELQEEAKDEKEKLIKEYEDKVTGYKIETEKYQQQADLAKTDLEDYKKSTEVAFDEFCDAKDRIDELEFELEKLKGGKNCDEEFRPKRRSRLARRASERSLDDDDDDAEKKAEAEAAGLTSYLSSWYYGAPGSATDPAKTEEKSPDDNTIDISARSHRSNTPLQEGQQEPPNADDKASWGAWGLTTYFHKDDTTQPDHEMNLTD